MRIAMLLFVLLAMGCNDSNNNGIINITPAAAKLPPFESWITFDSPDAPYSIALPKTPTVKPMEVGLDKPLQLQMCEMSSTLVLTTSGSDVPARINVFDEQEYRRIFDAAMNSELAGMQATLIEQKTFLYQGKYPTREYTANVVEPTAGKGVLRARKTLLPGKLLEHAIVAKAETITQPEVTKFLDSVKIKSK